MAIRYRIERGKDFAETQVFRVYEPPNERGYEKPVGVWYADGKAWCCECSGPLVAMCTACRHVKAVKRFIKRRTKAEPKH